MDTTPAAFPWWPLTGRTLRGTDRAEASSRQAAYAPHAETLMPRWKKINGWLHTIFLIFEESVLENVLISKTKSTVLR
jgi:hypothetical protein